MIHFMSFHEKQVERETIPPRVTREVPVEGVEVKVAIRRDGASDEAGSVIRHVTEILYNMPRDQISPD